MRFDDSLDTVLSAEMSTSFGAQSAWRQLVDLVGRRRVPADAHAIAELIALRPRVPPPVRAASARALAGANPPAALVRLFFDDEIAIAAPVLRVAILSSDEWTEMLPAMSPASRSILRHRRDLAPDVRRALDSFGAADFRLTPPEPDAAAPAPAPTPAAAAIELPEEVAADPTPVAPAQRQPLPAALMPDIIDWSDLDDVSDAVPIVAEPAPIPVSEVEPVVDHAVAAAAPAPASAPATPAPDAPPVDAVPVPAIADMPPSAALHFVGESPFMSVGSIALGLPVVAEALRRAEVAPGPVNLAIETPPATEGTFEIAELVARLQAYEKQRDDGSGIPLIVPEDAQPALFDLDPVQAQTFRFETDAAGVVRWIEGAARAPLIGLSLDLAVTAASSGSDGRVDGVAGGAYRRRTGFADARLVVGGTSDAAGQWRITGTPVFDRTSGRFSGYRGTARRPRADESAEPIRPLRAPGADALRQLVHELRTPTNAIAEFAEMIEMQLLGPVPQAYRDQAGAIRGQAADLLVAIDDIDLAARLETHALDLRADHVPLAALLVRIAGDLQPLAALRGTAIRIDPGPLDLAIAADERAVERLIGRLLSTLVASGGNNETIAIVASSSIDAQLLLVFDRPAALAPFGNDAILSIDAETVAEADGAPLLGTGFALRLARNLAIELGGALAIDAHHLTLRLPAAVPGAVGQVSSS